MSKIGKINISIPEKVKVSLDGNNLKMQLGAYKADFDSGNQTTYGEFLVQIAF